jgi:hypothetical protein
MAVVEFGGVGSLLGTESLEYVQAAFKTVQLLHGTSLLHLIFRRRHASHERAGLRRFRECE